MRLFVPNVLYVLYVLYVLDDQHVDGLYVRDDHHVYVENDELLSEQLVGTVLGRDLKNRLLD